jgi:hypothetical protein
MLATRIPAALHNAARAEMEQLLSETSGIETVLPAGIAQP